MMGLNLMALAMNLFTIQTQAKTAGNIDSGSPEAINIASLKSIESTWLKVPNACKAAGFNAQPQVLKNDLISAHAASVYQSFGA